MASIRGLLFQRGEILLTGIAENDRKSLINASINSIYEWYYYNANGYFERDAEPEIQVKLQNFITNSRNSNKYNQVIVDEAQDLMPKIIKGLYCLSDKVSCGADSNQDLQGNWPTGRADLEIKTILETFCFTEPRELLRNFRNTKQIFSFARKFSTDPRVLTQTIDILPEGEYPELFNQLNEQAQLNKIWEIVEGSESNIGIIVFSNTQVNVIRDFFRNVKKFFDFSYYYSTMPNEDKLAMEQNLKTPFILTYESCKGLEFDIVILPYFQQASWNLTRQKTNQEQVLLTNADGSPKMVCTKNHFYVAATRAKKQLYILYDWETGIFNGFNDVPYKLNNILKNTSAI